MKAFSNAFSRLTHLTEGKRAARVWACRSPAALCSSMGGRYGLSHAGPRQHVLLYSSLLPPETILVGASSDAVSALGEPGEGPRVLVIEDDADLARVLMTIFERHGAVVLHARTGREAVEVCPQFIPDLIVLDVMLPELNGFGVVEQLRHHEHLRHLPLAVYSVKELDDAEKERLRLGESIFMTKSRLTPQEFEQRAIGLLNWATSGRRERRRNDQATSSCCG